MSMRDQKEDKWCQEELELLLRSLPNVHDIRYRPGQREHGKDFTFELAGPAGEDIHCAIQAKFGDITGGAGELGTIKAQIGEAFETPYENIPGDERWVDLVYVLCSGVFKPGAIESLKGIKEGARGQRVRFMDGAQIEAWKDWALASQHSIQHDNAQIRSRSLIEINMIERRLGLPVSSQKSAIILRLDFTRLLAHKHEISDEGFDSVERLVTLVDTYNAISPLVPLEEAIGFRSSLRLRLSATKTELQTVLAEARHALVTEFAKLAEPESTSSASRES